MSLALHYWNGRCSSLLRVVVSEMTYTVSSGTLNSTIPYHTTTFMILLFLLHDAYTPHYLVVHLCLRRKTSIERRRRRRRNPKKILAVYKKKCLKLISLKLTVRVTFVALKLQIFCQDSWQYIDEHPYVYKISWNSNVSMDVGWNNSCHRIWIVLHLYT